MTIRAARSHLASRPGNTIGARGRPDGAVAVPGGVGP